MNAAFKMSRPSILTEAVRAQVANYLRGGATLRDAFACSGIAWSTAKLWMQRGRAPRGEHDEHYVELVQEMERAQASYRNALSMTVTLAVKRGSWQAAIAAQRRADERELLAYKLRADRQARAAREQAIDAEGEDGRRVILLYPVAMPEGASPLPQLPANNPNPNDDEDDEP